MEKIDPRIELVIYRFLRGELSASECEMLESWLREGRHRELFEKICNKENMLEKSFYFDRLDNRREKTWLRLERATGMSRRLVLRRWTVAASIMVPQKIGIMYLNMRRVEPGVPELRQERIVPGVSTAQLYLPDGKVVDLGKDSICDLQLFEGGRFVNERGTLTYKSDSAEISMAQYSEIRIPRGGEYKVVLPDGTVVWLNAESSLRFPTVFTGKERKVFAKGELYFDVKHDENKPFIVRINDVSVRVLGTKFCISAYPENEGIMTTLEQGVVQVTSGDNQMVLKPGYQAVVDQRSGKISQRAVELSLYTSWVRGVFEYENMEFDDLVVQLARWYDVQFTFSALEYKKRRFTGVVRKYEDLNDVLDMIEKTTNVKFIINGRNVTITSVMK